MLRNLTVEHCLIPPERKSWTGSYRLDRAKQQLPTEQPCEQSNFRNDAKVRESVFNRARRYADRRNLIQGEQNVQACQLFAVAAGGLF